MQSIQTAAATPDQVKKRHRLYSRIWQKRWLYLLVLPGVLYFITFRFLPLAGLTMAFQEYNPFLGFSGSPWVGLDHFTRFFSEPTFFMLLKNTLVLSFLNIVIGFPAPIIVALLLNEVRHSVFKRSVQTIIYIPHFMSWVVVASITYVLFTTEGGIINELIASLGFKKVNFLMSEGWFRPLMIIQGLWKETGWGTIIYLAALANVDVSLYEAAKIDGANRFQQLLHITLPSIKSTIFVMLILRMGGVLNTGFDQVYLLMNAMNRPVAEVFDTYVYTTGILQGEISYSIAVGLFKSIVSLILVLSADYITKKCGETGLI